MLDSELPPDPALAAMATEMQLREDGGVEKPLQLSFLDVGSLGRVLHKQQEPLSQHVSVPREGWGLGQRTRSISSGLGEV